MGEKDYVEELSPDEYDEVMVGKNIDLSFEFLEYLFAHPEMIEHIPDGAHVAILPEGDPELAELKLQMATEASKKDGKPVLKVIKKSSSSDGSKPYFSFDQG